MKSMLKLFTSIFLMILIVFVHYSCKKEDEKTIIVSGVVTNPQNGTPISGVTVFLDGKVLRDGVYNDNYSQMASATTDASGKFEIEIPFQVASGFRFRTFKQNYFDVSNVVSAESIQQGIPFNKNFALLPVAWVKLIINNVVNKPDDEIQYKYDGTPESCLDCCSNQFLIGAGNYHSTYKCKVVGNIKNKFYWTVRRDGMVNPFTDNIYCAAFDTTVLTINY